MILFLNGSINAGKSTVAKVLAQILPNTVVVEPDDFDKEESDLPLDQRFQQNLEDALAVVKAEVRAGKSCIVPYPLSQKSYEFAVATVKDVEQKIFACTLNPGLVDASRNRGTRELTDWERERIKHHHAIGIHQPAFGFIVDNSKQTPEQTAQEIVKMIS